MGRRSLCQAGVPLSVTLLQGTGGGSGPIAATWLFSPWGAAKADTGAGEGVPGRLSSAVAAAGSLPSLQVLAASSSISPCPGEGSALPGSLPTAFPAPQRNEAPTSTLGMGMCCKPCPGGSWR